MKKAIIAVVAVVLIGAIVLLLRNDGPKEEKGNTDTTQEQPANANPNMTTPQTTQDTNTSGASEVEIEDFAFQPGIVTIKVGQKVTWTNKDDAAHNVIFENPDVTDSGTLNKNDSYTHTFDKAGTFTYICSFHPEMKGTVVVTE